MGGEIKWEALPALVEFFGFPDVELLLCGLIQIREHLRTVAEKKAQIERAKSKE